MTSTDNAADTESRSDVDDRRAYRPGGFARADIPKVFSLRYSAVGLLVGVLFFALSLLPSLLPRDPLFQGVVSGISLTVGYGIGVLLEWMWQYLRLPTPSPGTRSHRAVWGAALLIVGVFMVLTIWQRVGWQNDVRMIFGMDPIGPISWIPILVVTAIVAPLLLVVGRAMRKLFRLIAFLINKVAKPRVARLAGGVIFLFLVSFLVNGVLVETFFDVANSSFSVVDDTTDPGNEQPTAPERSGSPDSLVAWDTLGRKGRSFVATGPTVDQLEEFHGEGAMVPVRVYAGLKSADTIEERAELVLAELQRAGGFDREVLVVATTTGTGFVQRQAVDSLEYLHNGNTAVVGVQYSYLPSWISLLADQEVTKQTAGAVFRTIHEYWRSLPEDDRPEIYVYGLSLGSFGAESILSSIEVLNEPIDGAFLTGPPFVNDLRAELIENRDPGSPVWQPIYQQGQTVRFTTLENALDEPEGEWGDTRVVYLQHSSDPVSFFSPDLFLRRPGWLQDGQRGPDVSPEMDWFPLITGIQVALDLPAAGNVPEGYGHQYSATENLDGWIAVTRPDGWTDEDTERLDALLNEVATLEVYEAEAAEGQ